MKAGGILTTLEKFETLLGLSHLLFDAAKEISKYLHTKATLLQEGVSTSDLLVAFKKCQRQETFYISVIESA